MESPAPSLLGDVNQASNAVVLSDNAPTVSIPIRLSANENDNGDMDIRDEGNPTPIEGTVVQDHVLDDAHTGQEGEEEEEEAEEEASNDDDIIGEPLAMACNLTASDALRLLAGARTNVQKLIVKAEQALSGAKANMGQSKKLKAEVMPNVRAFYRKLNTASNAFATIRRSFVLDPTSKMTEGDSLPQQLLTHSAVQEHRALEEAEKEGQQDTLEYYRRLTGSPKAKTKEEGH